MHGLTRVVAIAITLNALGATHLSGVAAAEDPASREQMIRDRERSLEQANQDAATHRAAAHRARVAQAERNAEGARRREEERATLQAVDTAATTLAVRLTSSPALRVVSIDGSDATLAAGRDVGMATGEAIDCVSRGAPIVVDGEQLGFTEKPIGQATVTLIQEKLATIQFAEQRLPPKVDDVCYRRSAGHGKLALMPLLHQGRKTRLGESIQQRLYRALAERGVRLVEREQLTRVIAEQKLGDSALLDVASVAHVGALAGADSVLMGSIDDTGTDVVLAARLVAGRDGTVVAAQEVALPKNEVSLAMLSGSVTPEDATLVKARAASEAVTLNNPAEDARRAIAMTERLLDAGHTDEASQTFVAALLLKPDLPEVRHAAKRFRALAKGDARAALARADALITAGVVDEAGWQFAEAVRLDPSLPDIQRVAQKFRDAHAADAPAALAKADALSAAGLVDEAAGAFVDSLAMNPQLPDTQAVALRLRAAADQSERQAMQQMVLGRQAAARDLLAAGDLQGADRMLAVALTLAPNDPVNASLAAELGNRRTKAETAAPSSVSLLVLPLFRP